LKPNANIPRQRALRLKSNATVHANGHSPRHRTAADVTNTFSDEAVTDVTNAISDDAYIAYIANAVSDGTVAEITGAIYNNSTTDVTDAISDDANITDADGKRGNIVADFISRRLPRIRHRPMHRRRRQRVAHIDADSVLRRTARLRRRPSP
jgi:hypothetical protein